MKTLKEKIEVMQAAERGEPIEFISRRFWEGEPPLGWRKIDPALTTDWNWQQFDYRVAPKPFEVWVNIYPGNGNICSHPDKETADKFAKKDRIRCVKLREVVE